MRFLFACAAISLMIVLAAGGSAHADFSTGWSAVVEAVKTNTTSIVSTLNGGFGKMEKGVVAAIHQMRRENQQTIDANRKADTEGAARIADANNQVLVELEKDKEDAKTARDYLRSKDSCYSTTAAAALPVAVAHSERLTAHAERYQADAIKASNDEGDRTADYWLRRKQREEAGLDPDVDLRPYALVHGQPTLTNDAWRTAYESYMYATLPPDLDLGDIENDIDARARAIQLGWTTAPGLEVLGSQGEAVPLAEWRAAMGELAGVPAAQLPQNEKLSKFEIMQFLVENRFGGVNFHANHLPSIGNESELLRESLRLQSVQLQVDFERYRLERSLASALSVFMARQIGSGGGTVAQMQPVN